MLNPATLQNGHEQFEIIKVDGDRYWQYDYRTLDGQLFSCVRKSFQACRKALNVWLGDIGKDAERKAV